MKWMDRPPLERLLLKLLLLLLAGAIINVTVAWTVANCLGEKNEIQSGESGTMKTYFIPAKLEQGWPLPAMLSEVTHSSGSWGTSIEHGNIVLAFYPIFPGFAINSIFYAAVLWMLFAVPGAVRRRVRRKRGQCAACGYSLSESVSDKCPECGEPSESNP